MIDIPLTAQQVFIGAVFVLAVLLVAVVFLTKKTGATPYERVSSILTPPEQRFYKALSFALQGRVLIMPKVRIADILNVRRTIRRKEFWRHFSKISQKHIDFVLVNPRDFTTVCVIELDDKSHGRPDRIKRDIFVNQIMAQSEIPLYRFTVKPHYDRAELLQRLNACL